MIYLDSSATSLQKPPQVRQAMAHAVGTLATPGRGGHRAAMAAGETALACREELAKLFCLSAPEKVVFTWNATHALNIALRSLIRPGSVVVTSGYEHNAVTRTLCALEANVRQAKSPLFDPQAALEAFEKMLPGADCAVCSHVSNVFGFVLPIERIAAACSRLGVPLVIDASQSAGCLPLDFDGLGAAFAAMPGHKGLLGPQGTGVLLCRDPGQPLLYGGTGIGSKVQAMPECLPERLEAGTLNMTGIAGLLAAVRYVRKTGTERILRHEQRLAGLMAAQLEQVPGLRLFWAKDAGCQTGVLSILPQTMSCERMAELLGARGIAVRAGLHCAPAAHETAGTLETGTLRLSFSPFNKQEEVLRAGREIKKIMKSL